MALHSPQQIALSKRTAMRQIDIGASIIVPNRERMVFLGAQVAITPIDMDYFGLWGTGCFWDTLLPVSKCGAGEALVPSAAIASTKKR